MTTPTSRVRCRTRTQDFNALFWIASGAFMVFAVILGTGPVDVRVIIGTFFVIFPLGLISAIVFPSTAVIGPIGVRRGWPWSSWVIYADIERIEVGDRRASDTVFAFLHDGSREPLLRFIGTIFDRRRTRERKLAKAVEQLQQAHNEHTQ